MKVGINLSGFDISSKGLSVQRRKMNLIAENIANADTVRDVNGMPYQKKSLKVVEKQNPFFNSLPEMNSIKLLTTNENHISTAPSNVIYNTESNIKFDEIKDKQPGEIVYMPDHPDADDKGYVKMSNVNIITEMTDMIAAARSYEANLTAFNASKEIIKDSLEI